MKNTLFSIFCDQFRQPIYDAQGSHKPSEHEGVSNMQ